MLGAGLSECLDLPARRLPWRGFKFQRMSEFECVWRRVVVIRLLPQRVMKKRMVRREAGCGLNRLDGNLKGRRELWRGRNKAPIRIKHYLSTESPSSPPLEPQALEAPGEVLG